MESYSKGGLLDSNLQDPTYPTGHQKYLLMVEKKRWVTISRKKEVTFSREKRKGRPGPYKGSPSEAQVIGEPPDA